MSRSGDLMPVILVVIVIVAVYFLFVKKGTDWAGLVGAWAAEKIQPAYNAGSVILGNLKGLAEGSGTAVQVDTPLGYNPSNSTWTLSDGSKLGLPQGMTPKEFCRLSPGSPVCSQINGG